MSTIVNFKLDGVDYTPPREWQGLEIEATFDNDSIQPNINLSSLNFVADANQKIIDWFNSNLGCAQGIPIEISINNNNQSIIPFKGHLDWNTYVHKSDVESQMNIVKENGLNSFSDRAQGITMQLLESNGLMPTNLGVNIPYVVENRKTLLENLQLISAAFITIKTGIDEVFKFINISADITTLGVAQAVINLTTSILGLVVLVVQLTKQLIAIQKSLFPLVRYFRGIKLKTFLQKGCQHLGYNIDFGTINTLLDSVVLCPSQNSDTEGEALGFLGDGIDLFQNQISGILRPSDFGYTLSEAFELINKLFYTKVAIINNTVHCKPYIDPYWTLNPSYILPSVLIETTPFYSNGVKSYNIPDIKSRILIEYAYDDSDKHTISNVNNSTSETIIEPLTPINNRYSTFKGIDNIQIPYSLCVRKKFHDDLYDKFKALSDLNGKTIQKIKDKFSSVSEILGLHLQPLDTYALQITARSGALKVENHFFSVPKIVYLENHKIPTDFTDKIGANALYNNYHKFKSFVPFVKDPNNGNNTNQRELYNDVKIPFCFDDFQTISNNSYFITQNGEIGKFTSIKWNIDNDYAIVNYYIYKNYLTNIKENTI